MKTLDQFSVKKDSADGYKTSCKPCSSALVKQWQKDNLSNYRNYNRNYREENREKLNSKNRDSYKANPGRYQAYLTKHRQKNLDKHLARLMIYKAIKSGSLTRPESCAECSIGCKPSAHHYISYAKENWYDVIFLCSVCHGQAHRQNL